MSVLYHATKAVKDWLIDTFGTECKADLWIKMGYPDERAEAEDRDDGAEFPQGVLSILNVAIDRQRLSGDNRKERYGSIAEGTIQLRALPIPVNIDYQFDIAVALRKQLWCIQESLLTRLYARQSVEVDTYQIYATENPMDLGDELIAENVWQNTFRFRIQAWLRDEQDVETAYVVLSQKYLVNDELQTIVSQ